MASAISAVAEERLTKEKQEPAPATADSQQGFTFEYCRDLLAEKTNSNRSTGRDESKIRSCMTTGKIE
jgi:hypothetical protein